MNMKSICLLLLITIVVAEPPRYRTRFQQQQQQQQQPQQQEEVADDAPYAPSGYRPSGAQFFLPSERQQSPRTLYGPPEEEPTTTMEPTTTESSETTTLEPESSQLNEDRQRPDAEEVEDVENIDNTGSSDDDAQTQTQGVYYVILPTGQLQKVQYVTANDENKMAYTAQLQYQNVEPIQGPIYAFNSNAQFLQLVQ